MPYQGHEAFAQQPVSPGVREVLDSFAIVAGGSNTSPIIPMSGASRFAFTANRTAGTGDMLVQVYRTTPAATFLVDTFIMPGAQTTIHEEYLIVATTLYVVCSVAAAQPSGATISSTLQVSTL